jgi:hypothetical protein
VNCHLSNQQRKIDVRNDFGVCVPNHIFYF